MTAIIASVISVIGIIISNEFQLRRQTKQLTQQTPDTPKEPTP